VSEGKERKGNKAEEKSKGTDRNHNTKETRTTLANTNTVLFAETQFCLTQLVIMY